jgi:diacylglycerol O-acyltransferase / wax synthase
LVPVRSPRNVGRVGCVALTRLRLDELVSAWGTDQNTPFQMALLCVFEAAPLLRPDGSVDVLRVQRELATRARSVPPLGRRVVWTRVGEGRPVWAEEPSFDPAAHIECATLPAGADLASWAANRIVRPLDINRPLWRAEVVDGLPGGRFVLILVIHHIVADGHAGVAITSSLLDSRPDTVPAVPPVGAVGPLPSPRQLIGDRLHRALAAIPHLRLPNAQTLTRLARGVAQSRNTMAGFRNPEPVTSLHRRIGPQRTLVIVRQPLEDLRRAGHALGVSVNDLLLAAVTGGLRELLATRGDPVAGLVLRTIVPAATGQPGQVMGMLIVDLPVGEPDPLRRIALIGRSTTREKARLRAASGDPTDLLHLPVPLVRTIFRRVRRFGSSRITLSVTDVTGPVAPLWLAGARLVEAIPVAPLVPLVPLSAAALSYAGELAVSVNADASISDLNVLAAGLERSFIELRELTRDGERLDPRPAQ